MFNDCTASKMKEPGNRVFQFRLILGQDGQSTRRTWVFGFRGA
jgi:hypothetical protein